MSLPRPVSSFIGRDKQVGEITSFLTGGARLLTLTGPGGSGKSRVAIEAAATADTWFDGSVFWVGLSALRAPSLVIESLARVVGAETKERVAAHIGSRSMLVVLDNFEQVIDAAPELLGLLESCPNLRVLVTSRELLRVRGEVEYAIPPLEDSEAVELFCSRARVSSGEAVTELCRRLDKLPLALELAAARTRVLSPTQILGLLSKRLDLFKGGRALEPRQRTLRATIEWSCQLLEPDELTLLSRLAVFEGGCTLQAVEEVTDADVDLLQSLVDKSLLQHGGERFSMLETIREYALELLSAGGEDDEIRSRHLRWCVSFVEESERELVGPQQNEIWLRMQVEFPNLRAAFARTIATGDSESALRLVACRRVSQAVQGPVAERLAWVEAALSLPGEVDVLLRARALRELGDMRRLGGELDQARIVLGEALAIQRRLCDEAESGHTAFLLGRLESAAGRSERAYEITEAAADVARRTGDRQALGESLAQLGEIVYDMGDPQRAQPVLAEGLGLARTSGDVHSAANALLVLGMIERDDGRIREAQGLFDQALEIQRGLSDWNCVSVSLSLLGDLALRRGAPDRAAALWTESLELQGSRGQWYRALDSLWGLGLLAAEGGQVQRAARLLGAEDRLRRDAGTPFRLGTASRRDSARQSLRDKTDEATFTRAWQEGLGMDRAEALAYAADACQSDVSDSPEEPALGELNILRAEGDYWTIVFQSGTFRLRDSKGLHFLAHLLKHPGREFHVLDLVTIESGDTPTRTAARRSLRNVQRHRDGNVSPLLDEQAKSSYRARLRDLEEELNEATDWADPARASLIRGEMDFLTYELTAAMGLGGRDRNTGSAAERARVNITRAVHSALARIREHSPPLADHLDTTIRTGTYCAYMPDPRAPISWRT
ncbi:MAG TPA: tetratricopeptide repeat protein [Acidimicrobiales bacterium]